MHSSIAREKYMTVISRLMIAVLGVFLAATGARAQSADEPTGVWQTQAGDARVRVSKCGAGLCGTIVSLRDKLDPKTGKPAIDDKNPDPAKAARSMIGLSIFIDMRAAGPNKWSGQIYNADDGKTYASNVSVAAPDVLKVEGCVGAFCGSENWSRVGR
jgi:uncharacterized protein (DUF2147 family)